MICGCGSVHTVKDSVGLASHMTCCITLITLITLIRGLVVFVRMYGHLCVVTVVVEYEKE